MGDLRGHSGADFQDYFSVRRRRKIWERYNRRGDSVDTGATVTRKQKGDA